MAAEVGQARSTKSPLATRLLRVGATLVALLMSSIWGMADAHSHCNRSLNLWPFLYYERNEESGREIGEFLWPFIYFESGPEGYDYGLRPLFSIRREEKNLLWEGQFLWPIGWYKSTPEKIRLRIFPLYYYNKSISVDGEEKSDYKLFPILFGGRSKEEGDYFAFFPLGGQLNRWLGRDRIRFFLFPLYADTTKGDYRSWHVLWPIFSYGRGEGERAYRFWPLFGHGYKVGEYSKSFILWPIFNFQRTGLDTENPSEALMILPFYAYQRSPERRTEAILWPFFTYTDNKRGGYKEWHLPWPIFSRTRGEDREGDKLWPIWGYKRKGQRERFYAFWPFYWSLKETSESFEKRKDIILPIYWSERQNWKEEDKSATYIRLWPLLSYERKKDDTLKLSLLSPLWFREGDGFQRNYSPFWTLYEYRRDKEGNRLSRVLWRLYRHERTASSRSLELIHLLAYRREGREKIRLSLLRGLLEYKREGSEKTLRFLYLLRLPLTLPSPPGGEGEGEGEFLEVESN